MLLALILQTAAVPSPPPLPVPPDPPPASEGKWSILVPVRAQNCPTGSKDADVTVCAGRLPDQRLPYPEQEPSSRAQPSNRYLTGAGALAVTENAPCATRSEGCRVGFGPPIVPALLWLAKKVGEAAKPKPDKSKRVAIPLDDPVPTTARP